MWLLSRGPLIINYGGGALRTARQGGPWRGAAGGESSSRQTGSPALLSDLLSASALCTHTHSITDTNYFQQLTPHVL